MFVGHQNGGALYAFDLDPNSNAFTFVGEYRTAYDETAALHFDRGNGRLYIWHDADWDTWEVNDLTSTAIVGSSARQLLLPGAVGLTCGRRRTVRAFVDLVVGSRRRT